MSDDLKSRLVRQLLRYEPETGKLYWQPRTDEMFAHCKKPSAYAAMWNARYANKEAFTARTSDGHRSGIILCRSYLAHRVIWLIVHGEWPKHYIDHINGDPADNRLSNLRDVPHLDNLRNQKRSAANTSGVTGISPEKRTGKWLVQIRAEGRKIRVGAFEHFDDAVAARKAAEERYGYHENHGRAA